MKRRNFLIATATTVLFANSAMAQTSVGGPILSDTTWLLGGSPYELVAPILIGQGATLTIDPGVEVHFLGGKFMSVGQGSLGPGALVARGTELEPIRFTSPAALEGSWESILFPDIAIDAEIDVNGDYVAGSILEHCIVEFGGGSSSYSGTIQIDESAPLINETVFQYNARAGLYADLSDGTSGATPSFRVEDSDFRLNSGGGMQIWYGSDHQVRNCTFEENVNTVFSTGGGLYVQSAPDVLVESCQFRSNSGGNGGGMFASSCTGIEVEDCVYEENAGSNGGGLHLSSSSSGLVNGAQFHMNTATSRGGGLYYASGSSVQISGCTFTDNTAASGAGGAYLTSISSSVILGSTFSGNMSNQHGGGLYLSSCSSFTVDSCLLSMNDASQFGGGIYQNSGSVLVLDSTIRDNTSQTDGGGIYANAGAFTLSRTTVSCNEAVNGGGGLYLKNGSPVLDGDSMLGEFNTFQGNTATMGDAIFNDRAFAADGSGDTSLEHLCWGPMDPNTVPNRLWDFFDDPSLGIMLATNYANCNPIECGCHGTNYCVTSPNSVGSGATVSYSGTTSIVNNDLTLSVTGCPANKPGLFFYGPSQIQVPFGDGQRCVGGALTRLAVIVTDGAGDGSQLINYANQTGSGQIVAGSVWNFQFWYRDPGAMGAGFNVSDGLNVQFCQ